MKNYILGLMLLLVSGLGLAQKSVSGTVLGKTERGTEPLFRAHVLWLDTQKGVLTDENGRFTLNRVDDTNMLLVRFIGFTSDTIDAQANDIQVILETGQMLKEAKVEYERESQEFNLINPLNTQSINTAELQKAACCNLSESFETNASVDASFTDALSGARKIEMLGLDGQYSQIMQDLIPTVRGLTSIYGLSHIPGDWINSIQISKGMGSVINGFESMSGQINVDTKNPSNAESFYTNVYANQGGRTEGNVLSKVTVNDKWSTTALGHYSQNSSSRDRNKDGFLDNPLYNLASIRNEWHYSNPDGWRGKYQVTALKSDYTSGENGVNKNNTDNLYAVLRNEQKVEAYAKTGYVWPKEAWRSFGSQVSGSIYRNASLFGQREYQGNQNSFRVNLLYSSIIGNTNNKFVTGTSYQHDDIIEKLDSLNFENNERIPGVFFEYTYTPTSRWTVVAGLRADRHNFFGTIFSPRLHARFSVSETASVKLAAGRGWRSSHVIMENIGVLASSRTVFLPESRSNRPYGLDAEQAWTVGLNYTKKFSWWYRKGSMALDIYHSQFISQVVKDLDVNPQSVHFYSLNNGSFSTSAQAELQYSPFRRVSTRLAYRWLDVNTLYTVGRLSRPLQSRHRAMFHLAYETKEKDSKQWRFSTTLSLQSSVRLPNTASNPEDLRLNRRGDAFSLWHTQVTRAFGKGFEAYIGLENILNQRQNQPILGNNDPFGPYFDASLVYGPIFGRMLYGGLRFSIE